MYLVNSFARKVLFFGVLFALTGCNFFEGFSSSQKEEPSISKSIVNIKIDQQSIKEGDSISRTITLERTSPFDNYLTVSIQTSAMTAFITDFGVDLSSVQFSPGEVSKSISLSQVQNSVIEPIQNYQLNLVAGSDYDIDLNYSSIAITSLDDDLYTVSFDFMIYSEPVEGDGLKAQLGLKITNNQNQLTPVGFDLPIEIEVSPTSTATFGIDFNGPLKVVIPAGQSSALLEYDIIDDAILEGDEFIYFKVIDSPSFKKSPFLSQMSTMISDNEGPIVRINVKSGLPNETGPAHLVVTISRTNADTTNPLTVKFHTTGTATAGSDFTMSSYTQATIAAGSMSTDLTLTVVNDTLVEGTESFGITLDLDQMNYAISSSGSSVSSYITDNDQTSENRSIELSATPQANPFGLLLTWPNDVNNLAYKIYRKSPSASTWGTEIATTTVGATSFLDTSISPGVVYEYKVDRSGSGVGFIYASAELSAVHSRGKLLLLIESSVEASLASEISRLELDLVGDGWQVIRFSAAKTDTVANVKGQILAAYNADPTNVKMIFILGNIPIPYSGNMAPDGHGDHQGAWPADVYYADIDGVWTDTSVNQLNGARPAQQNTPGDGKFDQSTLPSNVELAIGRVDLSNMPQFSTLTEVDLLRRYLNKNHNYRHVVYSVPIRGLIEDNWAGHAEFFGTSGWNNLGSLVGKLQITVADWLTTLSSNAYLWGWGGGAGSATSAANIATTTDYSTTTTYSVFNMLFGSYFGDWAMQNSFLRAPLAGDGYGLTSVWSGRPFWYFHNMAVGEPIGYSAKLTQNNLSSYHSGSFGRGVHIALMGDPSLRHGLIRPASSFQANITAGTNVNLSWVASADSVLGYHVYKSNQRLGPYTLLNSVPTTDLSFTDLNVSLGHWYYMVRPVAKASTNTAEFYNLGQGVFVEVDVP